MSSPLYSILLLLLLLILLNIFPVGLQAGGRQAFIIADYGKQCQTCHVAEQSRGFQKIICRRYDATLFFIQSALHMRPHVCVQFWMAIKSLISIGRKL
jgi:hypothetical protein